MEEKKRVSEPMVIQIQNVSDEKKEWVIFGFNHFNKKKNYGNDPDVRVISLTGCTYDDYVNETARTQFRIGKIRFQSTLRKNLQKEVFHHKYDVFRGTYKRKELNLSVMMDAYQQQNDILDISKNWKISNKTHISGIIHPESTITIAIYPIVSGEKIPRAGRELAPIIIQTTQSVKTPTKKKVVKKVVVKKAAPKKVTSVKKH